jgi:preprotein translocase SecE subunit
MIPIILTIGNYISINHGTPNDTYFILISFIIIFGFSFLTKIPQRFNIFLRSVKIELLKVSWINKDETITKMIKLLSVIMVCGIIIAFIDKFISIIMASTILYS